MAHMLMLEPEWEDAARAIADWLETLARAEKSHANKFGEALANL